MTSPSPNILMGIGNENRCDDGVGTCLARHFEAPGWIALACSTAPENFTSVVRRHAPHRLVLVDAAELGMAPGAFRRVPPERIADTGAGTHALPLSVLIDFLTPCVTGEILFIGIQPAILADGEGLTAEVQEGMRALAAVLSGQRFEEIEEWETLEGKRGEACARQSTPTTPAPKRSETLRRGRQGLWRWGRGGPWPLPGLWTVCEETPTNA